MFQACVILNAGPHVINHDSCERFIAVSFKGKDKYLTARREGWTVQYSGKILYALGTKWRFIFFIATGYLGHFISCPLLSNDLYAHPTITFISNKQLLNSHTFVLPFSFAFFFLSLTKLVRSGQQTKAWLLLNLPYILDCYLTGHTHISFSFFFFFNILEVQLMQVICTTDTRSALLPLKAWWTQTFALVRI